MVFKNAKLFDENFNIIQADLLVENGRITQIAPQTAVQSGAYTGGDSFDCGGGLILPGLIDIHIHGCAGADFGDASIQSLAAMSRYLASRGITSFCPASMTVPEEQLTASYKAAAAYMGKEEGAYIHGINMEGPFISHKRKGAQPGEHIRKPDLAEFERLNSICPILLADVAPEAEGATAFARALRGRCTVSAAHTAAPYELAAKAFQNGFSHATHLFNGMEGIAAREPGVATAVLDDENATAELICDGKHIYPALLRIAFRLLGEDRTVVVSDAMKASGLGDGAFDLGGQTVYVKNGYASLADGTFAASTSNLFEELGNILRFGIPLKQAVKSCTINPARVIGMQESTGSLAVGKNADLLVVNEEITEIRAVFIRGKQHID